MAKGIFVTKKKDGSEYYRASINRKGKKISLGSFDEELLALRAYREAKFIFDEGIVTIDNMSEYIKSLSPGKVICLLNLRDNGFYFKTPIYLRGGFFSYFLEGVGELKFDNEDLFYYSSHTIMKRGGHFFVNDYGTQYSLISRYGIKAYGVEGRDFKFVNGDPLDYRYENILIINRFQGVRRIKRAKGNVYSVKIHINGEFSLGTFKDDITAAICYNKAGDVARTRGIQKDFMSNYIEEIDDDTYWKIYNEIVLPERYLAYVGEYSQAED